MIATLLTLLMISALAAGKLHVSCQNRTVTVSGDDLVLQCQVDPRVDLSALTVDVKRPDLKHQGKDVVHAYRHGKDYLTDQMDQYKGRTNLTVKDLKYGTITVRISSVDPSDSGRYKVFVPQLKAFCLVDVTVVDTVKEDQQNQTSTSTSGPPVTDVTEPDSPGAANTTGGNVGVAISVTAVLLLVLFLLLLVLVKLGKIKICKKKLSGPTGPEAEQNSDGPENENLMTPETNNSHSTAQNGLMTEVLELKEMC